MDNPDREKDYATPQQRASNREWLFSTARGRRSRLAVDDEREYDVEKKDPVEEITTGTKELNL